MSHPQELGAAGGLGVFQQVEQRQRLVRTLAAGAEWLHKLETDDSGSAYVQSSSALPTAQCIATGT